jgi:hypothetical protein
MPIERMPISCLAILQEKTDKATAAARRVDEVRGEAGLAGARRP